MVWGRGCPSNQWGYLGSQQLKWGLLWEFRYHNGPLPDMDPGSLPEQQPPSWSLPYTFRTLSQVPTTTLVCVFFFKLKTKTRLTKMSTLPDKGPTAKWNASTVATMQSQKGPLFVTNCVLMVVGSELNLDPSQLIKKIIPPFFKIIKIIIKNI